MLSMQRACTGGETQIPQAVQRSQESKKKKKKENHYFFKKLKKKENTKYYIGNGHIYALT